MGFLLFLGVFSLAATAGTVLIAFAVDSAARRWRTVARTEQSALLIGWFFWYACLFALFSLV